MSEISKQALKVDNSQSFPNNNAGEITPSDLRAFNVNVIDSTVNQTQYTTDSGSWNSKIAQLNAFTASQQPSFTALNSFTASQLVVNSGVNTFTQSANGRLTALENDTNNIEAWTSSINEIRDDGVLQGYSTRFFFNGLVSASIVQNVSGPIANVTIEQDGTKLNTASFNSYTASQSTASLVTSINNLNSFTAAIDTNFVSEAQWGPYTTSVDISLSNLNSFTASADQRLDSIESQSGSWISESETGSFARTNVTNTFSATQNIGGDLNVSGFVSASNGFYSGPNTTALNIGDGSNVRFWSGSTGGADYYNIQLVPGVGDIAFSRGGAGNVKTFTLAGVAGNNTTFQNNPVVFNDSVSSLTVNAQSTAISGSGSYTLQASTISNTAASATTIASASFRGTLDVTGQSGGDGKAILLGHSGSLVLGNATTNTYYAALAHLSSSVANANTNLIFKTNTNTADTIVSGSGNIFSNPAAPTAGFKRYIGTSNIFTHPNSVPQISGSMGFYPTMNANIINNNSNAFTLRGPVSSSAYVINHNVIAGGLVNLGTSAASNFERANSGTSLFSNVINGTVNVIASKTPLSASVTLAQNVVGGTLILNLDSSSANISSNNINGTLTLNNSYLPGTVTAQSGLVGITANSIGGTLTIYTSGSNTTFTAPSRTIASSLNAGLANTISASFNGDSSSVVSLGLIGHSLVAYGNQNRLTGPTDSGWGGAFIGRFNDVNGNKAFTADTIFAVGTGNTTARKTGFLIDSGSNVFVEGSLTVSGSFNINGGGTPLALTGSTIVTGSLTITGSVYGNVLPVTVSAGTASLDFSKANYFTLTLPSSSTTNINVINYTGGQTAMCRVINEGIAASASFNQYTRQAQGFAYSGSSYGATQGYDILTFATFAPNEVFLTTVTKI